MQDRDASGVPLPLRELLEVLGQLADQLPEPADGNWDRRREVRLRRHSDVHWTLGAITGALAVHDKYPAIAVEAFAADCQRWTGRALRERLAEPLGYEPERDQDSTQGGTGGS